MSVSKTPRPWHVSREDRQCILDAKGRLCCSCGIIGGDYPSTEEREANANLIVRACNSHEALVAACHRCIQALTAVEAPNCEAVKETRAALKLAEGKP